jgi:hypothetical protein
MKIQGYVKDIFKNYITFVSLDEAKNRINWAVYIPKNQLISFNILNIGIDYIDNIKKPRYRLGQLCEIEISDGFAKRISLLR